MAFTPKPWANAPSTATKINAAALQDLETRLSAYTDQKTTVSVKEPPYSAAGDGTTDDTAAIQAAVTAVENAGGGVVFFPPGVYYLNNASQHFINLTPDNAETRRRVRLIGYGATIKLSANGYYFLRLNGTNPVTPNSDTFHDIEIAGFTIDCNNVDLEPTQQNLAVVVGSTRTRLNFKRITIEDVKTINVPMTAASNSGRRNIFLSTIHGASGEAQTVTEDITIRRCRFGGGNYGIDITGYANPAPSSAEHYIDRVLIDTIYHDTGVAPTGTFALGLHVHVGHYAYGGKVEIRNVIGKNSHDGGIEVNAISRALVSSCDVRDYNQVGYYARNFRSPASINEQIVTWRDSHARSSSATLKPQGWSLSTASLDLGHLRLENCSFQHANRTDLTTSGLVVASGGVGAVRSLRVRGFDVEMTSIAAAPGSSTFGAVFGLTFTGGSPAPVVSIRDVRIRLAGTVTANQGVRFIHIDFTGKLNVDQIDADVSLTGFAAGNFRAITLVTGPMDVLVRRVVFTAMPDDSSPRLVAVSAGVTFAPTLRVQNCAMSAAGSILVIWNSTAQQAATVLDNNALPTWPSTPLNITVGASAFSYQNLDGYRQIVVVNGGTVSQIAYNRGGNIVSTGATQGAFPLDPGDILRVTYTAAPTMTKIPAA